MQMQLRTKRRRRWLLALAACMGFLALTGLAGATLGRYVVDSQASAAETVVPEGDYVRVFEDGAPYGDPVWGAYYVSYVGSAPVVDVQADMAAGKLEGVAPDTGLSTTYKLFENLHADVQRVLLPDVSGFSTPGAVPGAVSAAIDPLTFGSEGPGHAVQVVYRDATGADRTGDLASSPAAAQTLAYLYLEEALLEDAPSGKSYRGPAPNIYVSSEVGSLSRLFSGNAALKNVLFCDDAPTAWTDLSETFKGCTSLVGLENPQAAISQALGMAGAFWGCSSLTSLPDGFAFPAGATDLSHVFAGCSSLASVPSGLHVPATATTVEGLFDGCAALAEVPSGLFSGAASLENMSAALRGCASLSGEFFVSRTVKAIDGCFDGAGASASPCFDADGNRADANARHAVVAWYYDDAAPAVASYAAALGKDGKAVMLPLVWEKAYVADENAPYNDNDGLGSYYIRYIGNADTVDVSQHMSPAGEILGTKIATTYRMFENARPNLKTVLMPDVSGLAAFDAVAGSLDSAPAVDALTFGTAAPDHFIELVYRDAAGADHTAEVSCANVQPYLYLDRTVMTYDSSSYSYSYEGTVPHVYLSSEISTLESVLYGNANIVSAAIDRAYNYDWTGMRTTFFGCTSLERLSPYFGVPPESVDMVGTFYNCSSLVSLPEGFVLPDIVQYMDQMFYNCSSLVSLPTNFNVSRDCLELFSTFEKCSSLQRLPEGFSIPAGVNDMEYMFRYCNRLEALPDDLAIPSPVTDARFAFYACTSLKTVPAGLLANATSLTEMGAMFSQCTSLETVPDGFQLPPSTTNVASFFSNCQSLSYVPGDFFERTSRQFNAQGVFRDCPKLSCDMTFSPFTFASTSLSLGAFDNSGMEAPKRYDASGNDVGVGNGAYAIVMRYDPACVPCEKYVPAEGSSVVKVALSAPSALALDLEEEGEGRLGPSPEGSASVEPEGSAGEGSAGESSAQGAESALDAPESGAAEAAGEAVPQEGCTQDPEGTGDVLPAPAALAPTALLPAFIMRSRRRVPAATGGGKRVSIRPAHDVEKSMRSDRGEGV